MLKAIGGWLRGEPSPVAEDGPNQEGGCQKEIPQSQKLDKNQKRNNAGGFSYVLTDENRLHRFLCLGSEGGTYYTEELELGLANATCIHRLIADGKGEWMVAELKSFSLEARTAKQKPILFALAVCARQEVDMQTKKAAYEVINEICRIPTHLFTFIEFCEALSEGTGWGRAHRRAIANWYLQFTDDPLRLAFYVTKYKRREGWSHRDSVRLSHPKPSTVTLAAVLHYITKGLDKAKKDFVTADTTDDRLLQTLDYLQAVEDVKSVTKAGVVVGMIVKYGLVREHIPSNWLTNTSVWKALLQKMAMTAMIRNLGKMSSIGLLYKGSPHAGLVISRLNDTALLRSARIHPFNVLVALFTYQRGAGDKGKLTWKANKDIVQALNAAFYKSFKFVQPTNQRYLLAVDVSGSMTIGGVSGSSMVTPRDASAALAMVTARTERHYDLVGFSYGLVQLPINAEMSLQRMKEVMSSVPMGATDCAQPMLWAQECNKLYDVFVVYTDCETWIGDVHPAHALASYRRHSGIWNAKLIVMGMTATEFTIADPNDPGMLDMAGFDSNGPEVMRNFVTGNM